MPEPRDEIAKAIVFIDFSQSKLSPEKQKNPQKQKFVKSVKLLNPIADKFAGDVYYFPLITMGERALIFRKESLRV